ncbi:hypothetical protein [Variovorax saccharolyticus]|uniref:hypothetical protein n=1 Tax=Variovorax saccharolyticus TaxID=3053516 RepID=UPI00257655A8|nr:hypothetical protein [Variovorax sp. J31P216]MDM0029851.1 hypothetical protein [Variovorax sp. J31P216]
MQPEYLARLGDSVRAFVREVEKNASIDIAVVPEFRLNGGGPFGQGHLEIIIEAKGSQLFAPTNGYFPDGAVRHEMLHVKRFHVDGVPRLTLADSEAWDAAFSNALGQLDNAIEHVAIVPVELQHHPERREHWEAVMRDACSGLYDVPDGERNLAVCMHWTFLRHVLPGSPQIEIARDFALKHALLGMADQFADHFLAVVTSKEEIVRLLFLTFPEIPWNRAALEYVNSLTGTRQTSIA